MKINTPKKTKPNRSEIADELGNSYTEAALVAKNANAAKEEVTARIKGIAKAEGVREEGSDKVLLEGKQYVVGFQEIPQYALSEDTAKLLLSPALLKSITKTQSFIDTDLFQKAVDEGHIPRTDADKILIKKDETIRVVVSAKK